MAAVSFFPSSPDWNALFEAAQSQDGYFTTGQAAGAGYSPQLLVKYIENGRIVRVRRGIYRLVHFPAGESEDLVVLWLWSRRAGVFSHETALWLHDLSDAMPSKVHMTLPEGWRRRRLRVPRGLVLHYGRLGDDDRTEYGAVFLTSPRKTLEDCVETNVRADLVSDAAAQARRRGLISDKAAEDLHSALDRRAVSVG